MKVWLCSEKDFYTDNQSEIFDFLPVHSNWPPDYVTFASHIVHLSTNYSMEVTNRPLPNIISTKGYS